MFEPSPFELLGVKPGASAEEVRSAYRQMVKSCHPDQFQDAEKQKQAQEKLIKLNLAYEAALKFAARRTVGFNLISQEEAKHFAQRLIDQGNLESALRQLGRADSKDAEWYFMQGNILMALKQYETAHQKARWTRRWRSKNPKPFPEKSNQSLESKTKLLWMQASFFCAFFSSLFASRIDRFSARSLLY